MLGRYEESINGTPLPQDWQEEFISVLNTTYHSRSEKDGRFFDVYGSIYNCEFLVVVSYIHKIDQLAAPITLSISHDITNDEKQMKQSLKNLVDLVAEILEDIFSTDNWSEYCSNWTENTFRGDTFHYKITRENISLTLQANELLAGNLPE